MSDATLSATTSNKAPWHLWTVAILSILWNGSGAYTILMAQRNLLPNLTPDEIAYYAAQATWFVVIVDIALFAPILAAIALCLRSKAAVWLFAIGLAAVCFTDVYDLVTGSSRALANTTAMVVTIIIAVLAVLQLVYAVVQTKRGLLR